jgi:hypothetical protein
MNAIHAQSPTVWPRGCIAACLLLTAPLPAEAFSLDVSVDTSALAGTTATLAFDFIDGGGGGAPATRCKSPIS